MKQAKTKLLLKVIMGVLIGFFCWLFIAGSQNIICGIAPGATLSACVQNVNFIGIVVGFVIAIIFVYVNIKWLAKK